MLVATMRTHAPLCIAVGYALKSPDPPSLPLSRLPSVALAGGSRSNTTMSSREDLLARLRSRPVPPVELPKLDLEWQTFDDLREVL